MTDPMSDIQACASCRFRLPNADLKTGVCRRHAPQVVLVPQAGGAGLAALWPTVSNRDGCGDGLPKALPAVAVRGPIHTGGPLVAGDTPR